MKSLLEKIKKIEEQHNVKILYASMIGSKLFGTYNKESSDIDIRFIFISNKDDILLKKDVDSIKDNIVSKNELGKNTNEAVDFDGWSLHNFFNLISKGETNAIDLLFSTYREDTIIYKDEDFIQSLQANKNKLLNKNMKSFIGYSVGQIKKFGIKGARYNELDKFVKLFKVFIQNRENETLEMGDNFNELSKIILNEKFSYIKFTEAEAPRGNKEEMWTYLSILGKLFSKKVELIYILERVERFYADFGNRTKTVANTKSKTDFKALSHSLRICKECEELLKTKKIIFPLTYADEIKEIKYYLESPDSSTNTQFIESKIDYIETTLAEIDILLENSDLNEKTNKEIVDEIILTQFKK